MGSPGQGPGGRTVLQSVIWCHPYPYIVLLTYLLCRHRYTCAQMQTPWCPVTRIPLFSPPPATLLPPLVFCFFLPCFPLFFSFRLWFSSSAASFLDPAAAFLISLLLNVLRLAGVHCLCVSAWLALWRSVFPFLVPISLPSTCSMGCVLKPCCLALLWLFQKSPKSFLATDTAFFLHSLLETPNL